MLTSQSELTAGDRERRASLTKSDEVKELVAIEVAGSGGLNRRVFVFFCMPRWPVFLFGTGKVIYIYIYIYIMERNN
jgi:hypothetical protein